MKKIVALQIVLAVLASIAVGWIFFRIRPKVAATSALQQQLAVATADNKQLAANAKPTPSDNARALDYSNRGLAFFRKQQYTQAVALYDKALAVAPDNAYAWSLKGYALFRAGQIPESIDANTKAIQLDPGNPVNYDNLAKSYCAAKQYADAEHALLKDPGVNIEPTVAHYFQTDGELQRVCKPILADLSKPVASNQ